MPIPLVLDTSDTERSRANALAQAGVGQAELSAREIVSRGDKSSGLVGIGDAGAPSLNPLGLESPLPTFVQPNVSNPTPNPSAAVPAGHFDALGTSPTAVPAYQQPDFRVPAANQGGTVSAKNPMGL
jgi:hypothetical protein